MAQTKVVFFKLYLGLLVSKIGFFYIEAQSQHSSLSASRPPATLQPTLSRIGCSKAHNGTSGVITSPGYPNNYASNADCEWKITVNLSKVMLIEFEDFDIEEDNECSYDKLTVQEQVGRKLKTIAKFCGSKIPSPLRTRSNIIRILFTSDESENRKGFKLKWKSVANEIDCGVTYFNSTSGTLQSPGFPNSYENSINCTYSIKVQQGFHIIVSIAEVDIEYGNDCRYDALLIQAMTNSGYATLGKFCGTKAPLNDVISTSSHVLLRFTSDESTNGKGFNITWRSRRHFIETGRRSCGRKYHYSTRIVGGTVARPGEFPWQAGMFWRYGIATGKYFCGGALISEQWIVTAAHCFVNGRDISLYEVKLGDQKLRENDGHEQIFNISAIIIHQSYNPVTYDNDVALVMLARAANLTEFVNTLCLPSNIPLPGARCVIAGWGATMEHGQASNNLLRAEVPIIDRSTCTRADIYGSKLTRNMICAGYAQGGIDTCQGDSGGPLNCQNKDNPNIWEVQGIASWGRGCGRQLRYGVYTKVYNFVKWMKCIIQNSERILRSLRGNEEKAFCTENATAVNATRTYTIQVNTSSPDLGLLQSRANLWVSITASKENGYQKSVNFITFISRPLRSADKPITSFSTSLSSFINITSVTSTTISLEAHSHYSVNLRPHQSLIGLSFNESKKYTGALAEQTKVTATGFPTSVTVVSNTDLLPTTMGAPVKSSIHNPSLTAESRSDISPTTIWMEARLKSTIARPHISLSYFKMSSLIFHLLPNSGVTEQIQKIDFVTSGLFMPESMITTNTHINVSKIFNTRWQNSAPGLSSNATNNTSIGMHLNITSSQYVNTMTVVPNAKSKGAFVCASEALHSIAVVFFCIRYLH